MATIQIQQYNAIKNNYYTTSKLYISKEYADSAQETGRQNIRITVGAVTNPWKLLYSIDNGDNWVEIVANQTGTTYDWTPNDGIEWTALLNGATDYDARAILIKVVDDALAEAQAACSLFRSSLTTIGIKPNHRVTECSSDTNESTQKILSSHSDPIYMQDAVIIDIAESWDSEAQYFEVYLEDAQDPGEYIKLHDFNYHPKALTATWVFAATKVKDTGAPYNGKSVSEILNKSNAIIRLHCIAMDSEHGLYEHSGNYARGSWFAYTEEHKDVYGINNYDALYATRTDLFTRVGIEKAVYLDEALALAQVEAGDGIVIAQRNKEGKRVAEDGNIELEDVNSTKYNKAYNLVISSKITEVPDAPRNKRGWFEITENSDRADGLDQNNKDVWITGTYSMGSPFYYDIVHNWGLKGENQGNFILTVYNVIGDTMFSKPVNEMVPNWESIDESKVRVYVVLKDDADYQPALPSKDDLDGYLEPGNVVDPTIYSRWFYYNIVEIIPELPVVETKNDATSTGASITVNGEVRTIGTSPVTERGFYYHTLSTVYPGGTKVMVGKGKGTFGAVITGLAAGTTYYIAAYAINSNGISFGETISRTTTP